MKSRHETVDLSKAVREILFSLPYFYFYLTEMSQFPFLLLLCLYGLLPQAFETIVSNKPLNMGFFFIIKFKLPTGYK